MYYGVWYLIVNDQNVILYRYHRNGFFLSSPYFPYSFYWEYCIIQLARTKRVRSLPEATVRRLDFISCVKEA